ERFWGSLLLGSSSMWCIWTGREGSRQTQQVRSAANRISAATAGGIGIRFFIRVLSVDRPHQLFAPVTLVVGRPNVWRSPARLADGRDGAGVRRAVDEAPPVAARGCIAWFGGT